MKPRKNIGGRTHFKQLFYPVLSLTILAITASAISAQTRRFTPTVGYPTFAKREPVLRVKPGEIIETNSLWGDWYERAGGAWPGEVGPFYIEGATPNDTLVVKILKVRPNRDTAVSAVNPNGISGVAADNRTRMLNPPLPAADCFRQSVSQSLSAARGTR